MAIAFICKMPGILNRKGAISGVHGASGGCVRREGERYVVTDIAWDLGRFQ